MSSEVTSVSLTIPSDLGWLALAREFINVVCQTGRVNPADTRAIVLAANEAVSNVIRHAHAGKPSARLSIDCRLSDEQMEILVRDEGEPFDLDRVPHLEPGDIRPGGRGVYLMRVLMDELSCQPEGQRGNVLSMVKRRTPGA